MTEVPKLRQRIAGKSIPLEKFVARKARKCEAQGGRLLLPALELAYILHSISRAPRSVIAAQTLPLVEAALVELGQYEGSPEKYGKGSEFSDDWCLARHLEGTCLRYIAYPVRWIFPHPFSFADPLFFFLCVRRAPTPSWTRTKCRSLKRKLQNVPAPHSSPCSKMEPKLSSIITLCILPVSAVVSLYLLRMLVAESCCFRRL